MNKIENMVTNNIYEKLYWTNGILITKYFDIIYSFDRYSFDDRTVSTSIITATTLGVYVTDYTCLQVLEYRGIRAIIHVMALQAM